MAATATTRVIRRRILTTLSTSWPTIRPIMPAFLTSRAYNTRRQTTPTSYLVALRGIAACVVVLTHLSITEAVPLLRWPFFAAVANGSPMVSVFYLISGYSLSYKPMLLIRRRQTDLFLKTLAGSIFRRWLRLFPPCILATFICLLMTKPISSATFWDWLIDAQAFVNPFQVLHGYRSAEGSELKFLPQLWTIPLEFRGSMVVFVICIGVCLLTSRTRMTILGLLVLSTVYYRVMYLGLFVAGIMFADASVRRRGSEEPSAGSLYRQVQVDSTLNLVVKEEESSSLLNLGSPKADQEDRADDGIDAWTGDIQSKILKIFVILAFLTAIFLCSVDQRLLPDSSPSFVWIHHHVPPWWPQDAGGNEQFWDGIGAVLLVWAIDSCPKLQVPLNSSICQYVGDLSFGIYVLHVIVMWTLGSRVLDPWVESVGSSWCLIPKCGLIYFFTFWAADYFARIDRVLVRWGHQLQDRLFVEW